MGSDRYVQIQTRITAIIVSGAEDTYRANGENVPVDYPAIADAAVIGMPDERGSEAVKTVVVLRKGCAATEEKIAAFARQWIAGYKLPKSIDFVAAPPRNSTGRMLRRRTSGILIGPGISDG